jgi:hypothetical protein
MNQNIPKGNKNIIQMPLANAISHQNILGWKNFVQGYTSKYCIQIHRQCYKSKDKNIISFAFNFGNLAPGLRPVGRRTFSLVSLLANPVIYSLSLQLLSKGLHRMVQQLFLLLTTLSSLIKYLITCFYPI